MKEEIKEGYKKTEIGVIPEDWEVKRLGELGSIYNGLSGKNKSDFGSGKPFIPYKNVFDNSKININYLDYVIIRDNEKQNRVKYGDIFFTTSSETPDEVGMSSVVLDEIGELYLNSFCFGFRLHNFDTLLPQFARYLLRGSKIRKNISKLAQGSTRFNLSKTQLLKISIPIPPLKEQQKIASILSTVDEHIEQTDKLIEKTKELKKGLMQKLLTKGIGHTEFKKTEIGEIPKEWEVKRLGDIADIVTGKTPPTKNKKYYNGPYPWVTPTDIIEGKRDIWETERQLSEKGFNEKAVQLPANTVLVTCIASIGKNAILRQKGSCNQQINAILPNHNFNTEYIYYWISNNSSILNSYAAQTAVPILNKSTFKMIKIPVPPLKEQQKIASILSEVDNQIEEYELKKEKLQTLKKGLMQQLLTGKIRVKV